jgi:hypothetical protein
MPDLDELDTGLRALADHGGGRPGRRRSVPAGPQRPSAAAVTSTATTRALPSAVLPDALQLAAYNETTGWQTAATPAHEGQDDPTSVCQRSTLAALGAIDVRLRTYRLTAQPNSGEVDTQPLALRPTTRIAVAEFPDPASGRAAFAKVQDWVRTCPEHLAKTWRVQDPAKVITPYSSLDVAGGFGETYLVSYSGDPGRPFVRQRGLDRRHGRRDLDVRRPPGSGLAARPRSGLRLSRPRRRADQPSARRRLGPDRDLTPVSRAAARPPRRCGPSRRGPAARSSRAPCRSWWRRRSRQRGRRPGGRPRRR